MATISNVVRWADNTNELRQHLAEGLDQIEAVRSSVDKMARSLGGENLIRAAHNYAAAVEKIGGAAKLTAVEKARINSLVTTAIEKYDALGRTAPQALRDLAEATKKVEPPTQSWYDKLLSVRSLFQAFMALQVVQWFKNFAKDVLDDADALVKLHDKTGLSIGGLQRMRVAGDDAGVSIETMASAINEVQKRLSGNDQSFVKALEKAGISVAEFKALAPEDQYIAISDALRAIKDPADQVGFATATMARAGVENLPVLKRGFDDLKGATVGMSEEAVRALDAVGDAITRLWRTSKSKIGEALGQMVINIQESQIIRGIALWRQYWDAARGQFSGLTAPSGPSGLIAGGPNMPTTPEGAELRAIEGAMKRQMDAANAARANAQRIAEANQRFRDSVKNLTGGRVGDDFSGMGILAPDGSGQTLFVTMADDLDNLSSRAIPPFVSKLQDIGKHGSQAAAKIKAVRDASRGLSDTLDSLKAGNFGQVFKDITGFFKGGLSDIGTGLLEGVGGMITGGMSTLISKGIGALWGGLKKLFGFGPKEHQTVDKTRGDFVAMAGGLEALAEKAKLATGSFDSFHRLIAARTVKDYEAAVRELTAAFDLQERAQDALNDALSRYNFTVAEKGPALAMQEQSKLAAQLFQDWQVLLSAGVDIAAVGREMADSVNAYLQAARATGIEVPLAMKPMLQSMIDMGLLTDAAGNIITDMGELGISFAESMSQGFDRVVASVNELTAAISRMLGITNTAAAAISNFPTLPDNQLPSGPDSLDMPFKEMAEGGIGRVTRPTLFLAGEAGPEDFAFSGANRSFGGGGSTVVINVAGSVISERELADIVDRHQSSQYHMRTKVRAA